MSQRNDGPLRFAVLGCGFWSHFQIAAWREVGGVELAAVYNRTRSKAQDVAQRFGVRSVYDDAEALLAHESLDFVDIITAVETHAPLVKLAAKHGVPVICQKPMAENLPQAREMVQTCRDAGVPLFIHENFRWQHPLRQLKAALAEPGLGRCFRGRITFASSFPVFDNQPFLRELEQFILTDVGSHILDVARFLFGDARSLCCRTGRVNPAIRGEDVATVLLDTVEDTTVTCEMSYATRWEHERFPETYVFAECEGGSVELGPDFWLRTTTRGGTFARRVPPPLYSWADPAYAVVHASIVDCNRDILAGLRKQRPAETTGEDNLKTVELVFGSYESAAKGEVVKLLP